MTTMMRMRQYRFLFFFWRLCNSEQKATIYAVALINRSKFVFSLVVGNRYPICIELYNCTISSFWSVIVLLFLDRSADYY